MNTNILTPAYKVKEMAEQGENIMCENLLADINDSILNRAEKGYMSLCYSISYDVFSKEVIIKIIGSLEESGYSCSPQSDICTFNPSTIDLIIRWDN